MPFTASQLGEVPARDDAAQIRVFDVELPYRRLGRCRMSDPVALALGTRLDQVAARADDVRGAQRQGGDRVAAARLRRRPRGQGRPGDRRRLGPRDCWDVGWTLVEDGRSRQDEARSRRPPGA